METHYAAEHFDKLASKYDSNDRMSKIARELLASAPPIEAESIVLDNACGPGIVTREITKQSDSSKGRPRIHATDISLGMITKVRENNWPGVEADVMDAQALTFADGTFTHSFTNMGIFLFPDPEKGAAELYRTLKPGGVAVITTLKQVGWIRIFQAAQRTVRPEAPLWVGLLREEWSTKKKLVAITQAGGFSADKISVTTAETSMLGNAMGDFIDSIKDEASSMITKDWSDKEKDQFEVALADELKGEETTPKEYEIIIWLAVAVK